MSCSERHFYTLEYRMVAQSRAVSVTEQVQAPRDMQTGFSLIAAIVAFS